MSSEFHKACRLGDLESIESIIKTSPQVLEDLDPSLGWSGLYRTVVCGHYKAVNLLLSKSTNPNIKNTSGDTALHQAVESNQVEIAELLLQYKADANIQREDGESPLHLAVRKTIQPMISLLISYSADPLIPNKISNFTALDYAEGNPEIIGVLKNSGVLKSVQSPEPQASPSPEEIKSLMEPELEECNKNSLYQWLMKIGQQDLFELLISQGYDDLSFLFEQMRSEPLTLQLLEEIGVKKIGQRLILLAFLEEEVHKYLRKSAPVHSSCCTKETLTPISSLEDWLKKLNLGWTFPLFIDSGFIDMETILFLMNTNYAINDEVLKIVGIDKIGHRQRILLKLKEEARNAIKNISFLISENEVKNTACGFCQIF